jgi:hypothetical protein
MIQYVSTFYVHFVQDEALQRAFASHFLRLGDSSYISLKVKSMFLFSINGTITSRMCMNSANVMFGLSTLSFEAKASVDRDSIAP